jgi:phenylpropionate dioxygenase-like ring-hydroxylating dioxygenase large terminal subunit
VFTRCWQPCARADQLAATGDYVTAEIAGEPILLVRDGDVVSGFCNVCRHRAGPVAQGCGRRQSLQCGYHGWTYALDGRLLRAPEMDGTEGFDPAAIRLPPVATGAWGPLVMACLEPERAPGLAELTAEIALEPLPHRLRRDYPVACNWKVYVDNYLEGYHIPIVHPSLHRELDYAAYRTETRRWASLQHAPLRPLTGDDRRYRPRDPGESNRYWWVFPNLMLNLYQDMVQLNTVLPLGVDRTLVRFDWFAAAPLAPGLVDFSDQIQEEDRRICETVQRNLTSRSYDRGRYSARRENGVHHFHGLLVDHLDRESRGAP